MFSNYDRSLKFTREIMMIWNFIMIVAYSTLFLLSTKYIITNHLSRDFLDNINYIPSSPSIIFFKTIFLYSIMIFMMVFFDRRVHEYPFENILYLAIEIILSLIIMKSFYFSYTGIIYIVFCDTIYRFKENKYVKLLIIPLSILLALSNYDFFSNLFP